MLGQCSTYLNQDEKNEVVETDSIEVWARFFEKDKRIVKQENYREYWISTVFLGLDHSFSFEENDTRLWFETMIFTNDSRKTIYLDGECEYQTRCETYEQALKMHEDAKNWLDNKYLKEE